MTAAPLIPVDVAGIHAAIRDDIVLLRMRPGQRLSENQLAQRFGTSRTPVRAALVRLVDEGLIDVQPQRGTFVSRISLAAVRRARFVRRALEIAIVRVAAEAGLPPAARRIVETAIAAQEEAAEQPPTQASAEAFTAADDTFHEALASGIGLADVWAVVEREKSQFDRIRFLSLPEATPMAALIAQHKAILAGIVAGDAGAAEAAMRMHMDEVLKVASGIKAAHPDLFAPDSKGE